MKDYSWLGLARSGIPLQVKWFTRQWRNILCLDDLKDSIRQGKRIRYKHPT